MQKVEKFIELYLIEYSVLQNSFCVRTVEETLQINHRNMIEQMSSDFVPIAVCINREQADALIDKFSTAIDDYVQARQNLSKQTERAALIAEWGLPDEKIA